MAVDMYMSMIRVTSSRMIDGKKDNSIGCDSYKVFSILFYSKNAQQTILHDRDAVFLNVYMIVEIGFGPWHHSTLFLS